jgi:hypothetical protein
MSNQKIKFVTGFGSFGGSTVAILEHCKLLSENGFEVYLYAPGDWHMSRFSGSRPILDFQEESEDIVIFHHLQPKVRPKCRRSILYLHEKSLWSLEGRDLLPFDSLAYVCEDQANFHGFTGKVIPNPVRRMVDPTRHSPPRENIAGIVGTIQARKRQHISIKKALEDGRSKVLLFGDFESDYFMSEIEPLLSERVVHMGLVDPDDRMSMYNMFDCLYMFSAEESASLVLGECRLLDKEVVKSEEVRDYSMPDDHEIVSLWGELFSCTTPVIGDYRVLSSEEKCEKLVCVVTHNRKELVGRWLRAWNNAERFGAKIVVLHACDGEIPDSDEMNNILSYGPDFYIPFNNGELRDMLALHLVLRDVAGLPEWDQLFWFTDDLMPMRKDFLRPFVDKLSGDVGLVAQCYEPKQSLCEDLPGTGCLPHIRTVAYALTRKVADSLVFPSVGEERERPYLFEHGRVGLYDKHILRQVLDLGYKFALCHSDNNNYVHWTSKLDWMWDCHLFSGGAEVSGRRLTPHEMWSLYESQFSDPGSFDPLLIFTPSICEEIHLTKGKISAIIPTFSSPINCFMRSLFSLLIRSNPNILSHVFIAINGPDSREGGQELQDKKQSFVEDLRAVDWSGMIGFNPGGITLTRTWSRIGHSQALEQCIPWVDTEFYLSMHDDVLIMDPSWCFVGDFEENKSMVMKTWGGYLAGRLRTTGSRLDMPHLNTIFTLCKKSMMTSLGVGWSGFSLSRDFMIGDYVDLKRFEDEHAKFSSLGFGSSLDNIQYKSISLDIGSFLFSRICSRGLDIGRFDMQLVKHFGSSSWNPVGSFRNPDVDQLESEIMSIKPYREIYMRYLEDE